MLDNIIQDTKYHDWRRQTVGEEDMEVSRLIAKIENGEYKTKELDLSLEVYNLRTDSFKCDNLFEFLVHYEMVRKAEKKYPVIISQSGQVVDGRHRICRAIMDGDKSIKAIMITDEEVI